jgi:hypothetical protein
MTCFHERFKLVSLWQIMKTFDAARWLHYSNTFQTGVIHGEWRHLIAGLDDNLQQLNRLRSIVDDGKPMSEEFRNYLRLASGGFQEECAGLELNTVVITIRKLDELIAHDEATYADFYKLADELNGRIIDEMKGKVYLSLNTDEAKHFEQWRNGWGKIIERFLDATTDIEESQKCFALARYAGCVYHSVQIVEVGLVELGTFIGVKDPKSGWTAVSNKLDGIVGADHKQMTEFERTNFVFLQQVQATTKALKFAWRNKISHAHGKLELMSNDFHPTIAEEILTATRCFMNRLATELPTARQDKGQV